MMWLLAMLGTFLVVSNSFAAAGNPTSGTCGDTDNPSAITWNFDQLSGTLTISGEGAMADYEDSEDYPWFPWAANIKEVTISEGITHIGKFAFCCLPINSVQPLANASRRGEEAVEEPVASLLPSSVLTIGDCAFYGTQLTSLTLPSTVIGIGEQAFADCSMLTTLTCLGTMNVPELENLALQNCPLTAIYVPALAVEDYKNADCWQPYVSLIQPIPEQGEEPTEVKGSEVMTVGNITYGSSYLPSYPQSSYSTTQQIYTKNEIGKAGQITSIAFYNYEMGKARSYDIYLSHTTKDEFDSNTDWVTVSEADKVFSGTVTLGDEWTVIDLDTPFQYDGAQNLLLTVDDNTGKSTGNNYTIGVYSPSGHQALYYYKSTNLDPTQPIEVAGDFHTSYSSDRKNGIRLCFETYPKPSRLEAVEVGDVSAQIQCSLRSGKTTGEAKAWNLRYRKVAAEGEEEQRYVAENNLTTRSFTIEGLTALTKYEVQVQAVFAAKEEGGEDILSDWTEPLVFTTNCCPVEEQAEIIYAVNSNYSPWYGYAIQFMDITDENNPVEAAYINPPSYQFTGGTLTLCCGHKYKVNWIYDENHSNVNGSFSLALFFEPGDKFFSMARGEAPTSTSELTTFVMDCTPYCVQMPQIVNEAGTTYNSATLTFVSQTKKGQVVYSTEPDFDPETATPQDVDFEELPQSDDPWGGTPPNASVTLSGLQPLTAYYVSIRSVCTAEPLGKSRWTKPVKVTTGSRYDAPTQVVAEPVNSSTEKTSWGGRGGETGYNLYYRAQAAGNPVAPSAIQTFGGGKGTGFDGEGIQSSYGERPFSNTLFVEGIPAGSSVRFLAGNGKSGAGKTKFLYGMQELKNGTPLEQMKKFDKKCLNDADRAAIIKELQNKIKELTDEEQIEAYKAEIEELNNLPTDAQKLEQMKTLEQKIKENNVAKAELTLKFVNGEITDEEFKLQSDVLKAQNALYGAELSELRAITTNAENPEKDGFAISRQDQSPAQSRGMRAPEDDTYIFFIRHSDPNGILLVKDLTITPPDQVGEWTVIEGIKGTTYTLTGLTPSTTYEVMVEPVYDDGTTGTQSPITVFTTLGEDTDPLEGVFSVSKDKKVQFAKGNLQYTGDSEGYEAEWSMAKQQYEILGEKNIEESYGSTSPADSRDLFCWSTVNNYCGVYGYYYSDDADAHFKGDFVDWGTDAKLASALGSGWSTLSKNEWNYLLNGRKDADKLKMLATVAGVKGLVLLPDEWKAPDGVMVEKEMTAEKWATVEKTGVVFLPVAGQMTATYDNSSWTTTTTFTEIGSYWTSTPAGDKPDQKADILTITDEGATLDADLYRRTYTAVRLVKVAAATGDVDGDGDIDEADLKAVIDYILGKTPTKPANADMDGSGDVDIVDLTLMINKM